MAKQKERRVSVRLDAEMWRWVRETMAGNDRDASWVIRSCIRDAQALDRSEIVTPGGRRSPTVDAVRKAGGA